MWLLAFAMIALMVGTDLRERGIQASLDSSNGCTVQLAALNAHAIGGWISFLGGVCLNVAVWALF